MEGHEWGQRRSGPVMTCSCDEQSDKWKVVSYVKRRCHNVAVASLQPSSLSSPPPHLRL